MIYCTEGTGLPAPYTYQQWLDCFMLMKQQPLSSAEPYEAAASGSFSGTPAMQAALQQQMVDTIRVLLNRSIKRFARDLEECITFHEPDRTVFLFKRFKKDVHKTLFFQSLSFLPEPFRAELFSAISNEISGFWNSTVASLEKQALEHPDNDLEDALYLIRRIKLFS